MQFKVQAAALNEALAVASIVPPRPVTPQGGAGYRFQVENGKCRITSRDALHQIEVEVEVEDVDGEGAFIYPQGKADSLKYVDGWIRFEAGHEEAEDRFWVKYESEGGTTVDDATFNPQLMPPLNKGDLDKIERSFDFPSAILREAINTAKGYLAKPNNSRVEDNYKTMQVFDPSKEEWAAGDGTLFAADGVRACYFSCDAFKGKGLSIHGQHLPFLTSFLAKCEGDITIKLGEAATFAVNSSGQVLGWAHHVKQHGKFGYYPRKAEGYVLKADKGHLLKALRFLRSRLDAKRDKIRVAYTHDDRSLRFLASEVGSQGKREPVGVELVVDEEINGEATGAGTKAGEEDFAINVNVDHLLDLLDPMKDHAVNLRVVMVPAKNGRRERALFRTIEEFNLDETGKLLVGKPEGSFRCEVTRFMPSKD